jgi:hypothetical protein
MSFSVVVGSGGHGFFYKKVSNDGAKTKPPLGFFLLLFHFPYKQGKCLV